jgi:LacI family transcriptional regulator
MQSIAACTRSSLRRVNVSLADVAREAGVHPGTASKALNPATRSRVAAPTARRVVAAAERLGYQPNTLARGLRTRLSYSVGLIVPDLTNPLFPPIARGVEEVLGDAAYTLLVVNTDNDSRRQERQFAALRARQCDGFIVATAHREDPLIEQAAEQGVPMVLVNRLTDARLVPGVAGDETHAVTDAVEHLVSLGHRRIAHIAGPQELSTGFGRYRAFVDAIDRSALSSEQCPVTFAGAYSEEAGRTAMHELLEQRPQPTAVVAGNDLIALGCLDTLAAHSLRCPDDISVVGFNDMPMMTRTSPPMTTIQLPKREIGVEAARLLMERIADPSAPDTRRLLLQCTLAIRASTAPPPSRP